MVFIAIENNSRLIWTTSASIFFFSQVLLSTKFIGEEKRRRLLESAKRRKSFIPLATRFTPRAWFLTVSDHRQIFPLKASEYTNKVIYVCVSRCLDVGSRPVCLPSEIRRSTHRRPYLLRDDKDRETNQPTNENEEERNSAFFFLFLRLFLSRVWYAGSCRNLDTIIHVCSLEHSTFWRRADTRDSRTMR